MPLTQRDASHFLRRVGFGGTAAEIAHFTGREIEDVVDEVLNLTPALPGRPDEFVVNIEFEWEAHSKGIVWWLDRMIDSSWVNRTTATPSPLLEKIALFWHDHFATGQSKVEKMTAMFEQNQLFRASGLGEFEPLCQQVSVGGAMLRYLDNETNTAGAPQENFARELMELFTMGVGHYTEDDVVEVARAWTGHNTLGWDDVGFQHDTTYRFYPERHDDGQKTIFGITRNWNGPEVITEICQRSRRAETARFVARRAWHFFGNGSPSDALIDELANVYMGGGRNGGNLSMKELLRAILEHPEFWASYRALVKTPTEYCVDLLRRTNRSAGSMSMRWYMGFMGQTLFDPPNVSGWGVNGYWLSTATAWGRGNFVDDLRWRIIDPEGDFFNDLPDMSVTAGVQHIFDSFGIEYPSALSRAQLQVWLSEVKANSSIEWSVRTGAVLLGALVPEFQLA